MAFMGRLLTKTMPDIPTFILVSVPAVAGQVYHNVGSSNISNIGYFVKNQQTDEERQFQFTNWGDVAKMGNHVVVLWLVKEGKSSGEYVLISNANPRAVDYNERALYTIGHPIMGSRWAVFMLLFDFFLVIAILVTWGFIWLNLSFYSIS